MSTDTPTQTAEAQATGGCCGSNPGGCSSHGQGAAAPAPMAQLETPTDYVYDPAATDAVVKLTEKASVEIKRFISEKNVPDGCVLRIALQGGGCSGFEPHLGFDNRVDEQNDLISEQFGIQVAMDRKFEMFMAGTTIDYLDGIDRRGFKFDNPNASSTCGCGKSFSV
ncbi:MAG: HesB/IscA family protein [Planctomycetota bacterium]|jgi:iron-sulfur cluster assembly protein